VPLIARHFLDQIAEREGEKKRFAPEVLGRQAEHRWVGNVRELHNVVYRAYVMARGTIIVDDCLPPGQGAGPSLSGAPTLTIRIGTPLAEIDQQGTLWPPPRTSHAPPALYFVYRSVGFVYVGSQRG
jgi:DNA-binding NtrC family response regulator